MRFAKKHGTMAAALAIRHGGVTAKELSKALDRTERLCQAIMREIVRQRGNEFLLAPRRSKKPGPAPLALVAIETRKEE